ncbi:MAG: MaoC family dehydratase N-terminal domain-containing protein, partial [Burkholderiales bacterium]
MTQDLEKLKEWIGRRETDVDHVTIPSVHRLAATLDRDDPKPETGDVLPIGWHAILFPRVARHSQLGPDGHPRRGDFLPPVPLPRRMFAGKRVTFHAELRVGDEVRRDSVIKEVAIKHGRSGEMVFVTVKTDISSPRGLAITEEQDIVYRGEPDPRAPPPPAQKAPGTPVWMRTVTPDPVLLFRYSALTFNGHR